MIHALKRGKRKRNSKVISNGERGDTGGGSSEMGGFFFSSLSFSQFQISMTSEKSPDF